MSEKINFAWPVTSEHAVVYKHFLSKVDSLKDILNDKRIVIFGAGIRGCTLLKILEQWGYKNIIFCDNNPEKQGHLINQYEIIPLEDALRFEGSQRILVSPENSDSMRQQLKDAGLIEDKEWFSFDISVYDDYLSEYMRPVVDHMLVLGDCAFTHIALSDDNNDSLGDMLKTQYGSNRCKVLAMHGIGLHAQYHIIRSLLERGEKPSLLFLLTVMEVLTPKAHLMPRTQHPVLIRNLVNTTRNPDLEFSAYADLAEERFNRFQVESFASIDTDRGEASEKLFMKMNYLFKIREQAEGVVYLKKTIRMLNAKDIPIVLYVPPVNYMQGESFFGSDFKKQYTDNFTKLYSFLDNEQLGYTVADASFLLHADEFAASNTIDETSNYTGRRKMLEFVIENMQLCSLFE